MLKEKPCITKKGEGKQAKGKDVIKRESKN